MPERHMQVLEQPVANETAYVVFNIFAWLNRNTLYKYCQGVL